jgi:pimeloyl-ACP methyl ester carboxylesterase
MSIKELEQRVHELERSHGMNALVPQDRYLTVNGLRLHYLEWGADNTQPVILLHGFMAHAHVWDEFAARFPSRYHLIALDHRGHGESQWSMGGSYTLDDHFSDIAIFIDTLQLENVILIGHSMGGRHALFYNACLPHKVDRLILIDTRPADELKSSHALRQLLTTFPLEAGALREVMRATLSLYPYLTRKICYHIAKHGYKRGCSGNYVPKYDIRMGQQSEHTGYSAEDLWPFLGNVTCPVLLMRGEESPFLSREVAHQMWRSLPRAELVEIPASTHLPVQENPIASLKAITAFLNKQCY